MSDLSEADHGICYYRSQDNLNNFRIKVTLKKLTSSGASLSEEKAAAGNNIPMQNLTIKEHGNADIYDEKIISWQEKLFSSFEFEKYSQDPLPDDEPIVKSYHNDVKKLRKDPKNKPGRLFTYVDHDNFSQEQETNKFTILPTETVTFAASKNLIARKCKPKAAGGPPPRFNLLLEDPTEEQKLEHHFANPPLQEMYIMANLCSDETPDENDEERAVELEEKDPKEGHKILCVLTLDSKGVLSMQPDFNRGIQTYRIEGPHGRESFEYSLEHASKSATFQDVERDQKLSQEISSRHTEMLQAIIGNEFELPPKQHTLQDMLRVMCYGEVVSAKDFVYDNLYVHFFIDLPQHWRISPNNAFSGTTQTCKTKIEDRPDIFTLRHMSDNIAYFGYPFEYEMCFEKPIEGDQNKKDDLDSSSARWPSIIFEVLSLDDWTRYRTEGYGYISLPTKPGTYELTSHCWRPCGNSVINELRRYFVGGTPELSDPSYVAIPPDFQGGQLGKYGVRTETTGQVTFRVNLVHQSRAYMESVGAEFGTGFDMEDTATVTGTLQTPRRGRRERFTGASTHHSVVNVINAFQRVRTELVHVREGTGLLADEDKSLLSDQDDDHESDENNDTENIRSEYAKQIRDD